MQEMALQGLEFQRFSGEDCPPPCGKPPPPVKSGRICPCCQRQSAGAQLVKYMVYRCLAVVSIHYESLAN